MIESDIKQIIIKESNGVPNQLKSDIIKQYIFDKTGENIEIILPIGQVSISATNHAGKFIFDTDLLEFYYKCSSDYYKNLFKIND